MLNSCRRDNMEKRERGRERLVSMLDLIFVKVESFMQLVSEI